MLECPGPNSEATDNTTNSSGFRIIGGVKRGAHCGSAQPTEIMGYRQALVLRRSTQIRNNLDGLIHPIKHIRISQNKRNERFVQASRTDPNQEKRESTRVRLDLHPTPVKGGRRQKKGERSGWRLGGRRYLDLDGVRVRPEVGGGEICPRSWRVGNLSPGGELVEPDRVGWRWRSSCFIWNLA